MSAGIQPLLRTTCSRNFIIKIHEANLISIDLGYIAVRKLSRKQSKRNLLRDV